MSSKVLPTLQGQRIKTRKRDEKEKFDPFAFRDSLFIGLSCILNDAGSPTTQSACAVPGTNNGQVSEEENQPDQPKNGDVEAEQKQQQPDNGISQPAISTTAEVAGDSQTSAVTITKEHLESLYKFLDTQGGNGKIDYRKYGEPLFDILIAGGILAPGGTIVIESDASKISKTELCVFSATDLDTIRGFHQVVVKLIRRYKYLEKTLDEEFKKIIKFLKGFTNQERFNLAKFSALLIAGNLLPASVLASALQDILVKNDIAGDFLVAVLSLWLEEKDAPTVWSAIRKAGLDQKIMDFFPANKRNAEHLGSVFRANGLASLLEYQKAGLGDKAKKELCSHLTIMIKDEASTKEMIAAVKESVTKNSMAEHEVVVLIWNTIMNTVEWNKKEELIAEQALQHLKSYTQLFATFTSTARSELALIVRIQEYCYENMNFLKVFQKIVVLLYKAEVLSEEVIAKWYKDGHSNKGKSVFLDQMKKFIEWLQDAEEESDEE